MAIVAAFAPSAFALAVSDYVVVAEDRGPTRLRSPILSADGSTVVGRVANPRGASDVYRWRNDGEGARFVAVPADLDRPGLEIAAISGDGSRAVGSVEAASGDGYVAFLWDLTTLMPPVSHGLTTAH